MIFCFVLFPSTWHFGGSVAVCPIVGSHRVCLLKPYSQIVEILGGSRAGGFYVTVIYLVCSTGGRIECSSVCFLYKIYFRAVFAD